MSLIAMQLSILTLNVWGIPYISSHRNLRMQAIAEELATGKYDIVSLQEVWSEQDSQLLQTKTEQVLPYAHYFYSGVMGAGLLVLSKYPIVGTLFHAWPVNGYFHRIQHADWFGGKGVGLCRIRIDNQTYVHLYNAHLHAEYSIKIDEYKTHRVLQAFDTAQFIEATHSDSVVQILAGDLNAKPDDLSYKILLHVSAMQDTCNKNCIATYENEHNSYTKKNKNGQRIDHIFLSSSSLSKVNATVLDYTLPLPFKIPNQAYSYSDHEAVLVKLQLDERVEPTKAASKEDKNKLEIKEQQQQLQLQQRVDLIKEAIALCDQHLKKLKYDRIIYNSTALVLLTTVLLMAQYPIPYDYNILYLLLKLVIFAIVIFCTFMGFLWNFMERHGTLSGRTSMQIKLNGLMLNN